MIVFTSLAAVAFGGLSAAIALYTGQASIVQGLFPLIFVILFLSSAFFPVNLLLEPAASVAEYNPLSFIVEGIREPVIGSLSAETVAEAFGAIALVMAISTGLSAIALRRRLRSGLMGLAADLATVRVLIRRASNEILRVPGAAIPGVLAPTIFFLGLTSVFGSLTELTGFDTDSYQSFILPVSLLQGAGFTGAATGVNLARDIEQGWFDRLLASPAPRPALLAGMVLSASLRSLIPAAVLLAVGFAVGVDWPGFGGLLLARLLRDGDRDDRRLLGRHPRPPLQDPERGPADAGRDVRARPLHHRLRADRAAPGLARRHRPDQPADPGRRRRAARASSASRSPGPTPGRRSRPSPACSRCSAASPCAGWRRTVVLSAERARRPLPGRSSRPAHAEGERRGVRYSYTRPSPSRYPWQWYWDSCFAAIVWRRFEPRRSREELESLLSAMRPDGFIGHVVFWDRPLSLDRLDLLQRRLAARRR